MKAVLLISHGSHSPKLIDEIIWLMDELRSKSKIKILEYAFLEIQAPDIPTGIKTCIDKGAKEIMILLNFLNSGRHIEEDIPRIIKEAKTQYNDISFKITDPVGAHPKITELFLDMIDN